MKKQFLFIALSISIFSCSNNKKERDELLVKITNENGVLVEKQSQVMKENKDELEKMSAFIMDMANAGAPQTTIDSLMKEKEAMTAKQLLKLKEIENQQNRNQKLLDSILAISK